MSIRSTWSCGTSSDDFVMVCITGHLKSCVKGFNLRDLLVVVSLFFLITKDKVLFVHDNFALRLSGGRVSYVPIIRVTHKHSGRYRWIHTAEMENIPV